MSWYAEIIEPDDPDQPAYIHQTWSFTSGCNAMIDRVMREHAEFFEAWGYMETIEDPWWSFLDGYSASEGADYLTLVVEFLNMEPEKFIDMEPKIGWGGHSSLLTTLETMRDYADKNARDSWFWRVSEG